MKEKTTGGMTRSEVRSVVLEVLAEVEAAAGVTAPPMTDDLKPLDDLPMFDSLLAEDTTVTILQRLGADPGAENPFSRNGKPQSILQVVNRLCAIVGLKEGQ